MAEIKKIIGIGNSQGVTISNQLMKEKHLTIGKYVKVSIEPIDEYEEIKDYICRRCGLIFSRELNDELYCPGCGSEAIREARRDDFEKSNIDSQQNKEDEFQEENHIQKEEQVNDPHVNKDE